MNDEPPPYPTGDQPDPTEPAKPQQPSSQYPPPYPTGGQPERPQSPPQPPPWQQPSAQYPPPYPAPQPGYGYPAPPPVFGYVEPSYSNGNAITALVLGILGVTFCFITAPVAIIFGWLGMRDAARGTSNARGLSIAGFILGIIGTLLIVGVAALFIVAASVDSTGP